MCFLRLFEWLSISLASKNSALLAWGSWLLAWRALHFLEARSPWITVSNQVYPLSCHFCQIKAVKHNAFREMPTSGDLKSGDFSLITPPHRTTPPPPEKEGDETLNRLKPLLHAETFSWNLCATAPWTTFTKWCYTVKLSFLSHCDRCDRCRSRKRFYLSRNRSSKSFT